MIHRMNDVHKFTVITVFTKGKNMDPCVECEGSKANVRTEVLFR